ncbi:MAG: metal ABC transporter permease [Acidimicrobiia bacterium]
MTLLAAIGYQRDWVEVLSAPFMVNALIAGTLVAVAAGLVGYHVVVRRQVFAAHALAHIGFPGATGAVVLGVPVTFGLLVFCLVGALAIGALGKAVSERDVATGTILAFATALGVLFASLASRSASTLTNILFGNLLGVSTGEIVVFACFTLVLGGLLGVVARPLTFASVDPQVAEARGVPVRALGVVFMVLLALVVTMSVQVVGTLLLFALVVTPSAAALYVTARPAAVVGIGTAIALVSVWAGLVAAAMFDLPPSFAIVTIAVAAWLVLFLVARTRSRH